MVVHGSAVAVNGRAVLVMGPSGAGKTALALALMALGGTLVGDDRCVLAREGDGIIIDAAPSLRGRIEARHLGILGAEASGPVPLALVVDLAGPRAPRLPPEGQQIDWLGIAVPLIPARFAPELAPALRQYLIGGRVA